MDMRPMGPGGTALVAAVSRSGAEPGFAEAAEAFRRFFGELREAFLEREWLFTQLELALLAKEHVLIIGPPGTAKSAIAGAVLARILDASSNRPSLFSKQLAENTVQTDLIGPVDFKVLTETGRTEYLTEEGMLGAVHAFLDEVFDGRDMLLRSILNVLHERELKHGRKVTPGRCECAVMTSNRYLSEVMSRSPETLQAFADRISFICFTPKSFARRSSRAQMLSRAQSGERPTLVERLTLQQLDVLQDLVTKVEVPPLVAEGLEQLADSLERELLAQVVKLPDYVPTKYFSQRAMVKALWALKAAVVRDRIYRRPERPLVATLEDLQTLRYFFLLGGPPGAELEALLKSAADPRERAQLEIIRVENRAFEEASKALSASLDRAAEREAADLQLKDDAASADAQSRTWTPNVAAGLAKSLREKLVPGPRHPDNRVPLLRAATNVVAGLEIRLGKGPSSMNDERLAVLPSLLEAFELARRVPELSGRVPRLAGGLLEYCRQAAQMVALAAENSEFEDALRLENVAGLAASLSDELSRTVELVQTAAAIEQTEAAPVRAELLAVRERVASALRRRAARTFDQPKAGKRPVDALDQLTADSRRLRELERCLGELSTKHQGLRAELLTPLGETYAKEAVGGAQFTRLADLTRTLQPVVENLRREGASVEAGVRAVRPLVEARVREYVQAIQPPRSVTPDQNQLFSGEGYALYRQALTANSPEGEVKGLQVLSELLVATGGAALPAELREKLATAEIASLITRVRFLRTWFSGMQGALPHPEELKNKAEADRVFDALIKSRFPLLVTKEGELVRVDAALRRLAGEAGERGEAVQKLTQATKQLSDEFMAYAKGVLDARVTR